MKSGDTGLKRILKAFVYSYNGFLSAFKSEAAFRQDLAVFFVFSAIAIILNITILHKIIMISALLLILILELVNTAIETIIDRISPDYHELSKKAKDIGSLLVLLSFINAILWWGGILFTDYLL
ncbi:MAG: diacylglycerol kinase [Alphaproteobacteria bacterium]|nr:diacylglycerol kinase [Alphaproteobacteria bacterium]